MEEIRSDQNTKARDAINRQKAKKKITWKRMIIFAIAEVIALSLIFGYAYILKQYNKIQRPDFEVVEVQNTDLSIETMKKQEGYWNIAVFGVDSRNSAVGKGSNTDVIMVVSINRANGDIKIVSIFRDSYLNTGNGSYKKINSAYAAGGPQQAVKALNMNLDLNITDYVTFNWKAVATGINILGGVDIELSKAELHYINGYITETVKATGIGSTQFTSAGLKHMDGIQAVAYARIRYTDSDYARTERQRKVLEQAFKKAKSANIGTLNNLLGNMLSMVATNLTWQDGIDEIANVSRYNIVDTAGFPFARGEMMMGAKGAVVIPQTLESNVKELHTFLFGDEDYQVSKTVKDISARIASDSGMYKEGNYIKNVGTDGNYIKPAETQATTVTTTEKTTKKNVDGREYEIGPNGETIWLDDENDAQLESILNSLESGEGSTKATAKESTGESSKTTKSAEASTKESMEATTVGPGSSTKATTKETIYGPTASEQTTILSPRDTTTTQKSTEGTTISPVNPGGTTKATTVSPNTTTKSTVTTVPPVPTTGATSTTVSPTIGATMTVEAKPE